MLRLSQNDEVEKSAPTSKEGEPSRAQATVSRGKGRRKQPPLHLLAPDATVLRLVPPPKRARAVARTLSIVFVMFVLLLLFSPWQQSVRGAGRVIAHAPLERQQTIEAPVEGRVVHFWVHEGSRVKKGDRIVEISDNDPLFLARLRAQRDAIASQLASYDERTRALSGRLSSVAAAREGAVTASEAAVRVAEERVRAAEQALVAAEADVQTATLNLTRQTSLADQGLSSERDYELAVLAETKARTSRESAQASLTAARSELSGRRADLERARAELHAETGQARATTHSAESDAAYARATLAQIESRLAKQHTQIVTAPRDGTILRLLAAQGGEQVKAADPLAILVPDSGRQAVELWVSGNDAALISPGRRVRLQFEGWPAVQFTGWPSVAVGTFGGVVHFVDATDDGSGQFRTMVLADPNDDPWPSPRYLRQGVRANGWVLLNRVRLGFELWRQFNGFPPSVRPPKTDPVANPKPSVDRANRDEDGLSAGGRR